MKISELTQAPQLTGDEIFHLVKDGVSYKATLSDIVASAPNEKGIYPDTPINRVTIKRFSGQSSTVMSVSDNLAMIDRIMALCFPVLVDRSSHVAAILNGNDIRKTADGLPATLDDWTLQVMTRVGGFYRKYEYNAATNEKIFKFSVYPVKGYKYVRRRFLPIFGGCVESHDGKSVMVSNSGKWTTQNTPVQNFHTYAKNLGDNFRGMAVQDMEVFRFLFWLYHKTFNSQSVRSGLSVVSSAEWQAFSQAAGGGQSSYAQFAKTGFSLNIQGMDGELSDTWLGHACKPNRFLWSECLLNGMYWIAGGGYLKKGGTWYKVNDLANIAFSITANYSAICTDPAVQSGYSDGGFIMEDFEDTMIPSQLGGSATTGHADRYWRVASPGADTVYMPLLVGGASNGSDVGVSVLPAHNVPSTSNAYSGGTLASDDPTDPTPDNTVVV